MVYGCADGYPGAGIEPADWLGYATFATHDARSLGSFIVPPLGRTRVEDQYRLGAGAPEVATRPRRLTQGSR